MYLERDRGERELERYRGIEVKSERGKEIGRKREGKREGRREGGLERRR
jgi:hypothetical protein